jgi:hypothetical protein
MSWLSSSDERMRFQMAHHTQPSAFELFIAQLQQEELIYSNRDEATKALQSNLQKLSLYGSE